MREFFTRFFVGFAVGIVALGLVAAVLLYALI